MMKAGCEMKQNLSLQPSVYSQVNTGPSGELSPHLLASFLTHSLGHSCVKTPNMGDFFWPFRSFF